MKPSEIDFTLLLHKEKILKEKITEVYETLERNKFDLDSGDSDKLKEYLRDTGMPGEKIDRIIESYEAQHPEAARKPCNDLEKRTIELEKRGRELNQKERDLNERERELDRKARNLNRRENAYVPPPRNDNIGDYHN